MKRGTTPTLPVVLQTDIENIKKVTFIFKPKLERGCKTKVVKSYPENVALDGDTLLVSLTEAETRLFDGTFYMDTRIETKNDEILETDLVQLHMLPTLFEEGWDEE